MQKIDVKEITKEQLEELKLEHKDIYTIIRKGITYVLKMPTKEKFREYLVDMNNVISLERLVLSCLLYPDSKIFYKLADKDGILFDFIGEKLLASLTNEKISNIKEYFDMSEYKEEIEGISEQELTKLIDENESVYIWSKDGNTLIFRYPTRKSWKKFKINSKNNLFDSLEELAGENLIYPEKERFEQLINGDYILGTFFLLNYRLSISKNEENEIKKM